MILAIATIIIGTITKIGRTGLIWWNDTGPIARTMSSEPETRETTGSGVTSIPTAKRGAKRDSPTVGGKGEGAVIAAFLPLFVTDDGFRMSGNNSAPVAIPQNKSFQLTSA
jgi:hypothetical protein